MKHSFIIGIILFILLTACRGGQPQVVPTGGDTLTMRYAEYLGMDTTEGADLSKFADAAKVSSWAKDAMGWAVAMGLIEGTNNAELMPLGTASRAEAATILVRLVDLILGE